MRLSERRKHQRQKYSTDVAWRCVCAVAVPFGRRRAEARQRQRRMSVLKFSPARRAAYTSVPHVAFYTTNEENGPAPSVPLPVSVAAAP